MDKVIGVEDKIVLVEGGTDGAVVNVSEPSGWLERPIAACSPMAFLVLVL